MAASNWDVVKGISGIAGFGLNFGSPGRNPPSSAAPENDTSNSSSLPLQSLPAGSPPRRVTSQPPVSGSLPQALTELFGRYDEACQACRVELDLIGEYKRWVDVGLQRTGEHRNSDPSEGDLGRKAVYRKMVAQGEIVKGLLREIRELVKAERARRRETMELDEFSLISNLEKATRAKLEEEEDVSASSGTSIRRPREIGGVDEEALLRRFKEAESAFSEVNSAYSDAVREGIHLRRRNEQKTSSLYLKLVAQSEQVQEIAKQLNRIQQSKKQVS